VRVTQKEEGEGAGRSIKIIIGVVVRQEIHEVMAGKRLA
jgi:hypothetical protein